MSSQMSLAIFVVAAGFITSAMASYGAAMLGGKDGSFRVSFQTLASIIWGFFVCLFAGPYLTLETSMEFWRKGLLSGQVFTIAVVVTMVWSFCTGVFVIQLLAYSGIIAV